MPLFDFSIDKLREYLPERTEPADFDEFWAGTLSEVRAHPLDAQFEPYDNGLATIETFDVTFSGWNGERVRGWLQLPRGRSGPLPCVVEFIGYGGGRGLPTDHLLYSSAGYAHFVMDSRGQSGADTGDANATPSGPQTSGFMTDGVLDPNTYYYRRIMSDVVRAIEAARSHSAVASDRIVVAGGSQGGGLTLAAAGLVPDVVGAMPDVPFLCHYRRATEITDKNPYGEIAVFCQRRPQFVETVFNTLSYFDGVNFAARANATALFSVGLMDDVCPPSTVYAAYNHYAGPKDITIWPYNAHEGGSHYQAKQRLDFLGKLLS
jgi:cephalosporin-C deacetylase